MKLEAKLTIAGIDYTADLKSPLDISIPFHPEGVRVWYKDPMSVFPVVQSGFTGSVEAGGSVNFRDIEFNPHAHGTHTECIGHITREVDSVNDLLNRFFFPAFLITVRPTETANGFAVMKEQLIPAFYGGNPEALIIRTLPNDDSKLTCNYSHTHFPFIDPGAMEQIVHHGVMHLLVDLPSVDPEKDNGRLLSHRCFWADESRKACTITELIYVKNSIPDGWYLLNLQVAPLVNDASPSRPVLFPLES